MSDPSKTPLSYRDAGVDIEAGERLVEAIGPLAKATARAGVMGGLGGFGALFDLKASGYEDPILVSGTDGVGTKLMLAFETGIHNTVGIDLVAMCANDVLAQGAEAEGRAVLDAVKAGGRFAHWKRAFEALPADRPRRALVRPGDRLGRAEDRRTSPVSA